MFVRSVEAKLVLEKGDNAPIGEKGQGRVGTGDQVASCRRELHSLLTMATLCTPTHSKVGPLET